MLLFIMLCLFLATILLMYLLSEANLTKSSYGIRRRVTLSEYEFNRYYTWYNRKELELIELHEEELCKEMTLDFDSFCRAIYNGFEIKYS